MRVLTSGSAWLGGEFGSIQSAVERTIDSAEHEILLVTYTLSTAADTAISRVNDALVRGIHTKIVVNRLEQQHPAARKTLISMLEEHERLRLYDFRDPGEADLHAKFLVVDHKAAIVGSANLSWRGLVSNHELAILIDHEPLIDSILAAAARMLASPMISEIH